ncbi:hypothetical protein DRW41_20825 [Neobacillus piezotolerans]|uniref:Uncharacterized protein n=1 Tax=Neobacillus piezotolerans TaxID=2259171 RepID=A0A3D8GLC2_9BACI|nr:hypothetical protein DRW41_20825 [Neobacillus piezotolerans]
MKIDILRENLLHTRHGKAAGCVSNLSHHRSQRPTLSIIHKTPPKRNNIHGFFMFRTLLIL